jgi:hypothetical protein
LGGNLRERDHLEDPDAEGRIILRWIVIIKANEMLYFSTLFSKEIYMFRTDLLSIIRSIHTVFTAIGIRHTSYVACLLARSVPPWPR